MKLREVMPFLGLEYSVDTFDCADLVVMVQRELFGRDIVMPSRRPRGRLGQRQLGELSSGYVTPTDAPKDGDLVLMSEFPNNKFGHVGVYIFMAHEHYVLHSYGKTQGSVMTRVRELNSLGLLVEGYYSWNCASNIPASS